MADNIFFVEDWLNGSVLLDDGTGTDWIVVNGTYTLPFLGSYGVHITMYFEAPDRIEFSVATVNCNQIGTRFGGISGTIENAQGGGGTDSIQGNGLANFIYGDPIDFAGDNDALYGRTAATRSSAPAAAM